MSININAVNPMYDKGWQAGCKSRNAEIENLKGSMEEHLLYLSVKHEDKLKEAIQAEREACAKVLEDTKAYNFTLDQLVAKIRARSKS